MKIPLSWLREYVDIDLPYQEVAHRLTMSGNEVGEIEVIGNTWSKVSVGHVVKLEPHPNADRLRLATVNLGQYELTVVCGAPNLSPGQRVPFAEVGARLIDARTGSTETLKAATIRGVHSEGMVCSERELGLGEDHTGILVLPEDAPIGSPLSEYLGDVIFNLDITPNRPDCLSVIGIAREISALTGKPIKEPILDYNEEGQSIESLVSVEIDDPSLCPRYTASVVRGIKVEPSPKWMQERLRKTGQRPINNVVDITNYVMLEYGQPLHAFDYYTMQHGRVIVRTAHDEETLITIDDVPRQLRSPMLVISDAQKPIALAGIMGGLNTEMKEDTTTVLIESANFDGINTRRTSQALKLRSESSSRFDKGLQPELAAIALRRATQLILQLAGGQACKGIIDVHPQPKDRPILQFTMSRLRKVLGVEVSTERVNEILSSLGFSTNEQDEYSLMVTVPYWRSDIGQEDDLIEEIARIIGYDNLPTSTLSKSIPPHQPQPDRELRERVKDILVASGMQEVISYSLTSMANLEKIQAPTEFLRPLRLYNPMSEDQQYLRTTLRGTILSTLSANQFTVRDGIKIFEVGRVYLPRPSDLPLEREMLVGVLSGPRWPETWLENEGSLDFFDAKGIVEALLNQLHLKYDFEPLEDTLFLPGRGARINIQDSPVGVLGEVHTQILESFQIDTTAVTLFELDLELTLQHISSGTSQYKPLPRYPGAYRDLALTLDLNVPATKVQDIIERNPLVAQSTLFDVYEGSGIPQGMRSLAYRILFQLPDRTLVGETVGQAMTDILADLQREIGASLRN